MTVDADGVALAALGVAARAAVVLALAGTVARTRHRSRAAERHALWACAIGGTLLLPVLGAICPAWDLPVPVPVRAEAPARLTVRVPSARWPVRSDASSAGPAAVGSVLVGSPEAHPARYTWSCALLMVWFCGALLQIVRLAGASLQLRAVLRASTPAPAPVADAVHRASVRLGVHPVDARSAPYAVGLGPLTLGAMRPCILMPEDAAAWPAEHLEAIALHEVAHVRRRDTTWALVAGLAGVLYWFIPQVWFAAHHLRAEAEKASDDMVLEVGVTPACYAASLLTAARSCRQAIMDIGSAASGRGRGMEDRIRTILAAGCPAGRAARGVWAVPVAVSILVIAATASVHVIAQTASPAPAVGPGPSGPRTTARQPRSSSAGRSVRSRKRRAASSDAEMKRRLATLTARVAELEKARAAHVPATHAPTTHAPASPARPVSASPPDGLTRITLRFVDAGSAVVVLQHLSPPISGLSTLAADVASNRLLVAGTPTAVSEAQSVVRLLDIKPRTLRVNMILRRTDPPGPGQIVAKPVIVTTNNKTAAVRMEEPSGRGLEIEVLPRLNGDASVSLMVKLEFADALDSGSIHGMRRARRVAPGEKMVVWMPDTANWEAQAAPPGSRPGYVLEMTAEAVK